MFAADMEEAKSRRISIEDFDATVVEQFIRYIHTDDIIMTLKVSLRELFLIADKYDVCGLKDLVQKQLIESLSAETVCGMFVFATSIANAAALQAACSAYIRKNRNAVKVKGGWQNLSESVKAELLHVVF